jgi:hypothetical protein
MIHSPLGAVGHVAASELPLGEAEPKAMGHVAAPESTSAER